MKNESVTVNGLPILFKRKLLIFLMSPSLQTRPGSTSRVMLTHKKTRLWPSENPHALHERPFHDQKREVGVAIFRRRIVGPLFFEETVNSKC